MVLRLILVSDLEGNILDEEALTSFLCKTTSWLDYIERGSYLIMDTTIAKSLMQCSLEDYQLLLFNDVQLEESHSEKITLSDIVTLTEDNQLKQYFIGNQTSVKLLLSKCEVIYFSIKLLDSTWKGTYQLTPDLSSDLSPDLAQRNILIEEFNEFPFQLCVYTPLKQTFQENGEQQYLDLLRKILVSGNYCTDRTNTGTLCLFGQQLQFDISKSFPLLTSKKMFWRGIAEELFFFLSGKTDNQILQAKGVHIWDNNCETYCKANHKPTGELGKFYGFQWRHWGAHYSDFKQDYTNQGLDQITELVNSIKQEPHSRRLILTAWNSLDINDCCLPPCHILYQFKVYQGKLSCSMYQRSADMFLGLPFNIASAALLTYLLAKTCDLIADRLIISLGDVHIYLNHLTQANLQLTRKPYPAPRLKIKTKREKLENYCWEDLELSDYQCHEKLVAPLAV